MNFTILQPVNSIVLDKMPSAGLMLLRAGFARKPMRSAPELLPSGVTITGVRPNIKQLTQFRDVCGFRDNGQLPVTFPQVMSTALQIKLMLMPEFPFNPMGVVHLRNQISQTRAMMQNEILDINVQTTPLRETSNGFEVDFVNSVRVADELVWQATATVLIRRKSTNTKAEPRVHQPGRDYAHVEQWRIPGNRGRRYARASGDFNPIHLYTASAKLLGFRRHIAHGMWSKSRCIAHLWDDTWTESVRVDTAFKLPVYLPATVTMMHEQEENDIAFELRGPTGRRPHLIGTLKLGI